MHRSSLVQKCVILGNKLAVSHTIYANRMNKFLAGSGIITMNHLLLMENKMNIV